MMKKFDFHKLGAHNPFRLMELVNNIGEYLEALSNELIEKDILPNESKSGPKGPRKKTAKKASTKEDDPVED